MGPEGTPFEGAAFAFDVMLPSSYPRQPPIFHFISFTRDRVNPNLYVEGKVW
jgi:ubiquitin-conjugating enzyme E2 O